MNNTLRHLSSFIAPITLDLILPYVIVRFEHHSSVPEVTALIGFLILGLAICAASLALFIAAVRMFILIGNGTIMPWDPTRKLIVENLYGYVRNPMILSLILLLIGEAILFASYGIAILVIVFFVINDSPAKTRG